MKIEEVDEKFKPIIETDSEEEINVNNAGESGGSDTAILRKRGEKKKKPSATRRARTLEEVFRKEDAAKKKKFLGGLNPLIIIIVVVMLVSALIPILELIFDAYKPSSRSKGGSNRKTTYKPPKAQPSEEVVLENKMKDMLRSRNELKKMGGKDLKMLLWSKGIPHDDLYEKKEITKRVVDRIIIPYLKRNTEKQLRSMLKQEGIKVSSTDNHSKEELIEMYLNR